jgi:phenylalanyl-tRNA synthetase beta chain
VLLLLDHLCAVSPEALPFAETPREAWIHPTVGARLAVGGKDAGRVYRVHPAVEARLELKGEVVAFDLDFDLLFESPRRPITYRPPSRYPEVPFDIAVVTLERTTAREVLEVLRGAGGDLLRSVETFDVFRGESLGPGKKSMAFHLVFGSDQRTLEGEEIKALETKVIAAVRGAGWPLRE